MSAQTASHSLAAAAALLECEPALLEELVGAAVREAERPSASSCIMPEPAIRVLIDLDGRLLAAERPAQGDDGWRLILPAST